jgi:ABC-2 type transport system ATP-binding protein
MAWIRVLQVRGAHHRYGSTVALRGVDLHVAAGECVALLGPNGAGKTTLVGLATGLLPTQGMTAVQVAGGDPRVAATRRQLGVVQQTVGFPRVLRVGELVRSAAIRAGRPADAAGPVLAEVGLTDLARRRAGSLSGGQAQRMQLAMALVADPALLILDEPTVGLDVAARRQFRRTLAERRDGGAGVLLTTHLVEEAASIADRVVVIHEGVVLADDPPQVLAARLPDRTVTARTTLEPDAIAGLPGAASVHRSGPLLRISARDVEDLVRTMLDADPELRDLRVEGASLEDALVSLTGSTAEVAA